MAVNLLVSGPPRSGKTTVIERVRDRLETQGYRAGGIYCPEIRSGGERVGFEIVDVMTGDGRVLAHVDRDEGPQVGSYRVDVDNVDEICSVAFPRAFEEADLLVIDEIAPMEVQSDTFVRGVRRALDSESPLIAAIHDRSTAGFIGEVKGREDTTVFEVSEETRDELPETLSNRLRDVL